MRILKHVLYFCILILVTIVFYINYIKHSSTENNPYGRTIYLSYDVKFDTDNASETIKDIVGIWHIIYKDTTKEKTLYLCSDNDFVMTDYYGKKYIGNFQYHDGNLILFYNDNNTILYKVLSVDGETMVVETSFAKKQETWQKLKIYENYANEF